MSIKIFKNRQKSSVIQVNCNDGVNFQQSCVTYLIYCMPALHLFHASNDYKCSKLISTLTTYDNFICVHSVWTAGVLAWVPISMPPNPSAVSEVSVEACRVLCWHLVLG